MHKNSVRGFDSQVCPPLSLRVLIQFTRLWNSVTNRLDLLLLDHSLQYCAHSAKLALVKAIASLQQSTHKTKWTLYGRFCSLCFVHMCMYCKIILPISLLFHDYCFQITFFFSKKDFSVRFFKIDPTSVNQNQKFFKCSKRSGSE